MPKRRRCLVFNRSNASRNPRGHGFHWKIGAKNAGILAVQMLALSNPDLQVKLNAFKQEMAAEVESKAKKLSEF